MKKGWKLWSAFTVSVLLGAIVSTVLSYSTSDGDCYQCPSEYRKDEQKCRACCGARCEHPIDWEKCLTLCRGYQP
ncbi:hypothetical protein M2350_000134 [Candidatus Fervidibacter sacchari]|uniref:4Fe-4S ferredoxin-type domain-containing protein n=1 Tax=Candidatus Fervidibacter sacchari TaxID=1448929 RepID=A0ABT2EIF6_9BACT|nr:hypothetical protein [Candidatus Fervidibacter sacchari]